MRGPYSLKTGVLPAKLIPSKVLQGQCRPGFVESADAIFEEDVTAVLEGDQRADLVVLSADLHMAADDRIADTPFFLLGQGESHGRIQRIGCAT